MILQRVHLSKLKTDDGNWEFTTATVCMELWIQPRTLEVKSYRVILGDGKINKVLGVTTEQGAFIPVELLSFSNDFKILE